MEKLLRSVSQVGDVTLKRLIAPFEECFKKYEINTPARQLCLLAQLGHESGGLFYTEELASGKAYEWRQDLGNTHAGDGVKYKGRGFIQITGRSNYAALSKEMGVDFVNVPTMLGGKNSKVSTDVQLRYAVMSAGWFWNKNKLNAYADKIDVATSIEVGSNLVFFKTITKVINGGYNGLQDRISKYRTLQKAAKG